MSKFINDKIFKIIWIIGIYSILGIILYLVIEYKVVWENKDLNTYLYFYNCDNNLCTTNKYIKDYYNKVTCEKDYCPHITTILGNNVILSNIEKSWIYNYKTGTITNDDYINYKQIQNNNFIVTTEDNKQGVIDISGNIIVNATYRQLYDYKDNILLYKENNQFKINNNDTIYELDQSFSEVLLINKSLFAAKKDNKYHIYNYNNLTETYSKNEYDYIYTYGEIIFTVHNKKIDILTGNLDSALLMKIDTLYEYKTEKERGTLEIKIDGDSFSFNVDQNSYYTKYIFNLKNNYLFSSEYQK